jgi:hypothetical protein
VAGRRSPVSNAARLSFANQAASSAPGLVLGLFGFLPGHHFCDSFLGLFSHRLRGLYYCLETDFFLAFFIAFSFSG